MPIASEPECETANNKINNADVLEKVENLVGTQLKQTPQPPTTTRTIIFLDWDDTLLCSSVLAGQGIKLDTNLEGCTDLLRQLDELSTSCINVLNIARTYGDVHIVTNGETGWVQLSAKNFMPRVVPLLEKVTVLSARSTYEKLCPDSPMAWKLHAFNQSLQTFYGNDHCYKNVLSFGDSHAEREAILAVTRNSPFTRTKSVKFAERPSIEQLQRQLELVGNCFEYVNNHEEDLDLCMSLSVAAPAVPATEGAPGATTPTNDTAPTVA